MSSAPHSEITSAERIKHLEFIQAVITRQAANSFLIKGWTVTLTTGLIAVSADRGKPAYALAALVPALVFWSLDAYYLRQERLFRRLYDDARRPLAEQTQPVEPFSLSVRGYLSAVPGLPATLTTPALLAVHGVVLAVALVAVLFVGR